MTMCVAEKKLPQSENRLDRLPSDCLLYILSFCDDYLEFDYKRKIIHDKEFQKKLWRQYLNVEYENYETEEEVRLLEITKQFKNYPAGSFKVYEAEHGIYKVEVNLRQPLVSKHNKDVKVEYSKTELVRDIQFKTGEELESEVRDRLEDGDVIYIQAGFILDNLYKKQQGKIYYEDIEELQKNEMSNVILAICNMDGLVDDVVRYDGYANTLGMYICEEMDDGSFLVEYEN